jgi:hypothetical protein
VDSDRPVGSTFFDTNDWYGIIKWDLNYYLLSLFFFYLLYMDVFWLFRRRVVFYTCLYRTFERMVIISEDGYYYSAYNGQVNSDADNNGFEFMVCNLYIYVWDIYVRIKRVFYNIL